MQDQSLSKIIFSDPNKLYSELFHPTDEYGNTSASGLSFLNSASNAKRLRDGGGEGEVKRAVKRQKINLY